jgi:NRPS condensation-like uncharacterized protein
MVLKNLIYMERVYMKNELKSEKPKIKISKFPPTIASYYKNINKVFAKYISMNIPVDKKTVDSSGIIPVNGHDICNYIAKYDMANFQIQAIMKLDGRLDFDVLVRAVRLSVDAEPVLGCRFIKSDPPYWKRFDDIDNIKFCSIEETDNSDDAVQRFLESPLDMDNGPMIMVKLIRSGTYDTLGLKINHVCSDGAGAMEYIRLISDIYSRTIHEDNVFVPKPSIRSKKDHFKLISALGQDNPKTSWGLEQQIASPTWKFPWKNNLKGNTCFELCRLPYGHLDILNKYAKTRGATINDLLLTAIFRAMFEISKPPYGVPMDIPITINLRQYLPDHKAEAIRNLSGGIVIRIDRKANEFFDGTLSRVMYLTKKMRRKHPSIKNLMWAEYIEKLSFHQICAYFKAVSQVVELESRNPFNVVDKCSPVFSNVGFISKSLIKFGENVVTDAYIIPPVVRAPGILLVASTYNGIITLAVGYYEPSVRNTELEMLLNKIRHELVEGCSNSL